MPADALNWCAGVDDVSFRLSPHRPALDNSSRTLTNRPTTTWRFTFEFPSLTVAAENSEYEIVVVANEK
jgi:hypothetical protein